MPIKKVIATISRDNLNQTFWTLRYSTISGL